MSLSISLPTDNAHQPSPALLIRYVPLHLTSYRQHTSTITRTSYQIFPSPSHFTQITHIYHHPHFLSDMSLSISLPTDNTHLPSPALLIRYVPFHLTSYRQHTSTITRTSYQICPFSSHFLRTTHIYHHPHFLSDMSLSISLPTDNTHLPSPALLIRYVPLHLTSYRHHTSTITRTYQICPFPSHLLQKTHIYHHPHFLWDMSLSISLPTDNTHLPSPALLIRYVPFHLTSYRQHTSTITRTSYQICPSPSLFLQTTHIYHHPHFLSDMSLSISLPTDNTHQPSPALLNIYVPFHLTSYRQHTSTITRTSYQICPSPSLFLQTTHIYHHPHFLSDMSLFISLPTDNTHQPSPALLIRYVPFHLTSYRQHTSTITRTS